MEMERSATSKACKPRLKMVAAQVVSTLLIKHKEPRALDDGTRVLLMNSIVKSQSCTHLSNKQVEAIIEAMQFYSFKAGDIVLRQGDIGHHFFVAQEGVLEVIVDGKVTNTLVAGCSFGAVALLYNCRRTATVSAKSACGIWGADGNTFRNVLKEHAQKCGGENRRFLDSISLLDGLTARQKECVGQLALVGEDFEPGERVISEGEATTSMYCVKKGELSVIIGGLIDKTSGKLEGGTKVASLRSGDCFGERAALYREGRSSSVVADTHCELLCIGIPQLKEALGEDLAIVLQRRFVVSILRKLPVIAHLSIVQQRRLAEVMEMKTYDPGCGIEEECRLMLVMDGEVTGTKGNEVLTVKRGEWCQDDALGQLAELGGHLQRLPARSDVAQGKSGLCNLRSGSSGCRLACLTKQAMLQVLQELGLASIGEQQASEDQIFDYMRKLLLAKKVPIFRDLSEDQIDKLVNVLVLRRYHHGAHVFQQGEVGRAFFVVANGEVTVSIDGKPIRTLGHGTCFGERAVLFDEPRSATVQVSSGVAELWSMDQKEFREVVTESMRGELVKRIQLQSTNVTLKSLKHVRNIGAGSFGSVRLVEHRRTKMRYALKRIRLQGGEIPNEVQRERDLLAEVDHPFVLRLVKCFETKHSVYMLTELITGGQLFMQTNQRMGVLSRKQAQFYVGTLVVILEALHDHGIVYRDLKPENVMLDAQGYLKLVDFGLAKKLDSKSARTFSLVGTLYYLAPEVVTGHGYGVEVDIWSLGVLFYELVCGKLPFGDGMDNEHDILVSILEDNLRFPGKYADHAGKKLIQGMLHKQPGKRTGANTWDDVKDNKFFKAGITGNIFNMIIGREMEPPVVPAGEEYPPEDDFDGKINLSDADELGSAEDTIVTRVLEVFRRVKLGGDGCIKKEQLAKVLRVLNAEAFNDQVVDRLWEAVGAKEGGKVKLEDFLAWMSTDDGEAFQRIMVDIHS